MKSLFNFFYSFIILQLYENLMIRSSEQRHTAHAHNIIIILDH